MIPPRIAVPNCVKIAGGASFDHNSFITTRSTRDYRYYRHMRGGLCQPPLQSQGRLHLSDVRHLDTIGRDRCNVLSGKVQRQAAVSLRRNWLTISPAASAMCFLSKRAVSARSLPR